MESRRAATALALLLARLLLVGSAGADPTPRSLPELPEGFVDLREQLPDLVVDLRYAGSDNFVGAPVDGYLGERAILTREAAAALARVQAELRAFGLGLELLDAYRPQRAVDHFVRWARDPHDTRTRARFYPGVEKRELIPEGYIAERSSHSRGSTVDVTIVALDAGQPPRELDMGTPWDFFGPESWPDHAGLPAAARSNRLLLRSLMQRHGFLPYAREWWHFTLRDEPFPERAFDFPVR